MDRRSFFRSLASEAMKGAREIAPVLNLPGSLGTEPPPPPPARAPLTTPELRRTIHAAPTTRCLTLEELVELAADEGLGARADDVRALARPSARLTLAEVDPGAGRTRLGGVPDLPADVPWPDWNGDALPFIAQIDLAELAAASAAGPLPSRGLLAVFCAGGGALTSTSPERAGATRVLWIDRDPGDLTPSDPAAQAGRRALPSGELTLPRVWSARVQKLGFDAGEHDAWQRLRERIAELQGAVPPETTDGPKQIASLHRLLGHPDERIGTMPLACELVAQGVDAGDEPAASHPRAAELARRAVRWRLLLQLTVDDELGWSWGPHRDRLYLWIDADDLAAADFSRVWAIAQ